MSRVLSPETRSALAARLQYCRDLGIYDFYRRGVPSLAADGGVISSAIEVISDTEPMKRVQIAPAQIAPQDVVTTLKLIREDIGDCTRCKLHGLGRKQIVFGVGNPNAELMFVGEGPGADEDQQGEPFVGRAGQLLNKMIAAMGLKREEVYIANVVKCRPPGNRTPERDEVETCSPFLMRQIDTIRPKAIVALGAVAAKCLLGISSTMSEMRGQNYDFRGSNLFVTYHPAYLLRDPRQKAEAWKDLQRVMKFLGLAVPNPPSQ
ncbi:MAG: uracil-DNA glycosylase [Candidatus Korobacteraceae bacterium]